MNDGEIGHSVNPQRRKPIRNQHIFGHANTRHSRQLKLYVRNQVVRLSFETLDDSSDDCRSARAAHGKVD
jgi:hypothetical protein